MENIFKAGGSDYIRERVNEAVKSGRRTAVISGSWEIDKEIRLPSDFTLILEDAHLRLSDGSHTNVFVNEHNETDIGSTPLGTDKNISIIGRGKAVLDGGNMNDVNERVPFDQRSAPIYKNNLILFTNVDGFKIEGIKCINQRWWATNFIYCRNGYIGNIEFCSDDRRFTSDGKLVHGLLRSDYGSTLVKNSDGVDLRVGCQNITVENVTGFTEDDTVALTGLTGNLEQRFRVDGLSSDIAFIRIKNVRSAAFCTNVRLLNQGDIKLHDIDIDGVYDTSEGCEHLNKGLFAVRIGDRHLYGYRHCTKDETYNISVKNVYGRGTAAISLAGEIGNLSMYGIECAEGTKMFYDWQEHEAR